MIAALMQPLRVSTPPDIAGRIEHGGQVRKRCDRWSCLTTNWVLIVIFASSLSTLLSDQPPVANAPGFTFAD